LTPHAPPSGASNALTTSLSALPSAAFTKPTYNGPASHHALLRTAPGQLGSALALNTPPAGTASNSGVPVASLQ
jgi:hypothetical protein